MRSPDIGPKLRITENQYFIKGGHMGVKKQEHTKILEYLIENNGKNLRLLDDNLVLYSPSDLKNDIQKEDNSSLEDFIEALFENPYVPYITNCDLPCFKENTDSLVILELKTEKADYKAFGQILYYLLNAEVVKEANSREVKSLEGIILAPEIDISLKDRVL